MAYIDNADRQDGCIFCDFPRENRDRERLILARGRNVFVIMNAFPYNPGHLMVAPYRHEGEYDLLEEEEFLAPFLEKAKAGGILVVSEIKRALDQRLNRNVPLCSAYNLLHRHGWRKLAPDKRHPKADIEVQEEWKKNFQTSLPKSRQRGG